MCPSTTPVRFLKAFWVRVVTKIFPLSKDGIFGDFADFASKNRNRNIVDGLWKRVMIHMLWQQVLSF